MTAAAVLLAVRFVAGPFRAALVTVNSPSNPASAVAVSFVLLTLIGVPRPTSAATAARSVRMELAILIAVTALAFWPNLRAPFVYDDYTHIVQSSHANWRILVDAFRREPGGHGLFFRPVGFISYWLDYQWAGAHPIRWHLWSLAVHAIDSCLVYVLVRRLGIRGAAAFVAALLFALHGSRAEPVAWSDARFDLLATFFALGALLCVLELCRTGRRLYFVPVAACAALAVCTKESAFCLPLLPAALLPCLPRAQWRRALAASLALGAICATLFAYRWWALGGIGGYAGRGGVNTLWHSQPLHTFVALFFRQWAFLFFPVNWSVPVEWWLRAAGAALLALLIVYVARASWRGAANAPLAGLAFLLAADIPVQHILLFEPDFAGARVLYLPLAGFAIFWAATLERSGWSRLTWVTALALIGFNAAALEHNLVPWRTTPAAGAAVCRALGSELAKDPRPVFVSGLPSRLDGVYFLSNGFPECVQMNSGEAAARVHAVGESTDSWPQSARRFVWNPARGRLEEKR